jgi:hypothetical protein
MIQKTGTRRGRGTRSENNKVTREKVNWDWRLIVEECGRGESGRVAGGMECSLGLSQTGHPGDISANVLNGFNSYRR